MTHDHIGSISIVRDCKYYVHRKVQSKGGQECAYFLNTLRRFFPTFVKIFLSIISKPI